MDQPKSAEQIVREALFPGATDVEWQAKTKSASPESAIIRQLIDSMESLSSFEEFGANFVPGSAAHLVAEGIIERYKRERYLRLAKILGEAPKNVRTTFP